MFPLINGVFKDKIKGRFGGLLQFVKSLGTKIESF
jgi:hypothetical protein